jgi:SRSO17 transposase
MGHLSLDASESRFSSYAGAFTSVIDHADRARPLRDYGTGLMMPYERKSVEPMAALPAEVKCS